MIGRAFRQFTGCLSVTSGLSPGLLVPLETALAAALALLFIGEKSFWLDEGFSVAFAKLGWSDLWRLIAEREANQGLYYLLLRPWLALGDSEAAVRSLSAIFAAATIPMIYALGSRLFGTRVGLVAGLLMAVNGFFIQYAQEARAYSLLLLLVTASSYLFVTCLEAPSWRRCAAYALVSGLAVYAHFFAALVLIGHAASLAFLRREQIPWRSVVAAGVFTALLVTPIGLFVLFRDSGQVDWVAKPSVREPAVILVRLAGGGVPAIAYFVACAAASAAALRAWLSFKASPETWRYAFLLSWLFVPLILAFAVSQFEPIFVTRFFMICLPPLVLLAAAGVSQVGPRLAFGAALGVLVLFSLYGVGVVWYTNFEKDDWRDATSYVLRASEPGDAAVFFSPLMTVPFDYYRGRLDTANDNLTYIDYSSGLTFPRGYLDGSSRGAVGEALGDDLAPRFERVWLVLSNKNATGRAELAEKSRLIQSTLEEHYALVTEEQFVGIRVFLYEIQ